MRRCMNADSTIHSLVIHDKRVLSDISIVDFYTIPTYNHLYCKKELRNVLHLLHTIL